MEENSRRALYRRPGTNCRDTGPRHRGRFTAQMPEVDRFWRKVKLARGDACWRWKGRTNRWGYGQFKRRIRRGVTRWVLAHRLAYELLRGPIPEGMTLDHLCNNPDCVRPSHLEPVPNAENVRRRHARRRPENGATA